MKRIESALKFLNEINELGYEGYIVGGAVVNIILGNKIADIDITTNMPVNIAKNKFNIIEENNNFLIYKVEYNGIKLDITNFRKEIYKKPFFPKVTKVLNIKEDLIRRDLTINTILMDKSRNYIDYMGGMDDINNKIIRLIGDKDNKILEDPTRLIRIVRFAIKYNFKVDSQTKEILVKYKSYLDTISKNKMEKELNNFNPKKTIEELKEIYDEV